MKYYDFLIKTIKKLSKLEDSGELAYLALTSKIENPLRDRIAFAFFKEYASDKMICREWKSLNTNSRADLAVLDKQTGKVEFIVEFKAHSSIKGMNQWVKSMRNDFEKNQSHNCEFCFVLFANYIADFSFENYQKQAIKYFENIKKAVASKIYTKESLIDKWNQKLAKEGFNFDKFENITVQAGQYENQTIEILAFIHSSFSTK